MAKFCFTGNPFVDAGIAGMCAAAEVDWLADLDEVSIDKATDTLLRVMTSEAMFQLRQIDKKPKVFATSEMSVIFPNGPLSQSSYPTAERKRDEYRKRVQKKYDAFKQLASGQAEDKGLGTCFVDGSIAHAYVGNDEFPLVDSKNKRNFHPGLQGGHAIGALTALALEFFPLSVLRTGVNSGFFWFVHTPVEKIAIACARLTLNTMNAAIARHEGLGFFGDWKIPSRDKDAALVALVSNLVAGSGQSGTPAVSWKEIEIGLLPVTAYDFSNDNRGAQITAHDLPHQLFGFFDSLRVEISFSRFNREVLQSDHIGCLAAKKMLACEQLINVCVIAPQPDKHGMLRGGWIAHSLYATEVLSMSSTFIHDIEAISDRVAQSDKVKDFTLMLQKEGASSVLSRLNRQSMMTFDEYVRLVPPEDRRAAFTVRDYLLAAIYERQSAEARGEAFASFKGDKTTSEKQHPLILLAERIGGNLSADASIGKKAASDLAKSQRISDLRGVMLRLIRRDVLSWNDFVQMFPPDEVRTSYQMRDYILAYLYDALRDPNLPDAEPILDRVADLPLK